MNGEKVFLGPVTSCDGHCNITFWPLCQFGATLGALPGDLGGRDEKAQREEWGEKEVRRRSSATLRRLRGASTGR